MLNLRLGFSLLLAALSVAGIVHGQQTVGLFARDTGSQDGYVLFAPISSTNTYLIDKCGKNIHTWYSAYQPGLSAYLLEDGSLLRTGNALNNKFNPGGSGGIIEQTSWNSQMIWNYTISSNLQCQHHDVCRLPNGNILAIVWEAKPAAIAVLNGRNPNKVGIEEWPDKIVELRPSGSTGATIVWEWHAWDHLIQDFDQTKAGYGVVASHPELININYKANANNPDWMHTNSVAYNAELDQIILSVHNFNEIWVIDHSTTVAEAASHTGGIHNHGGDLLYRWGNPAAYDRGNIADQTLFLQHNARWIPAGFPDAGKIMIYNNGVGRPGGDHSTVDVIVPPTDPNGEYIIGAGLPYGPVAPYWQYADPVPGNFFAAIISGAQRLSNGNTLICEGTTGRFFEVDSMKNIVWEYVSPISQGSPIVQGSTVVQNMVFRCEQYAASYPGFIGHALIPGQPLEANPLPYTCSMGGSSSSGIASLPGKNTSLYVINPFSNTLNISAGEEMKNAHITLTNTLGTLCGEWHADISAGKPVKLDVPSTLATGIYILRVANGNRQIVKQLFHE